MERMTKEKRLPKIPKDKITPAIVTGIDALGRGNDLNRLDIYLQGIAQVLGPENLNMYLDMREYMTRRASALGIDTSGLIRSEEEVAGIMQQQQQAEAMRVATQSLGPNAVKMMAQQQQAEAVSE